MTIITFNCNGIRARLHQIKFIVDKHDPDIICLQEIKCQNDQFPISNIENLGFNAIVHGQKSHHGVATLYKKNLLLLRHETGQKDFDDQKRLIRTSFKFKNKNFILFNSYCPQGESQTHETKFPYKTKFYELLIEELQTLKNENILITGDFNITTFDEDIGIGALNVKRWLKTQKTSFLPIEREWMQNIYKLGFKDMFAFRKRSQEQINIKVDLEKCGQGKQYSWFDYRSRGFDDNRGLRIDYFLFSAPFQNRYKNSYICYETRACEKPSDHAPVVLQLQ